MFSLLRVGPVERIARIQRRGYSAIKAERDKEQLSVKEKRKKFFEERTKAKNKSLIEGKTGLWEISVGLEIHAQIVSNTKLFSSARNAVDCDPNSCVSFVDAAFPGALPVLNEHCVYQALRTGIALNGRINELSRFDRKHYFYHDLPMGYQITQYFEPIVSGGVLHLYIDDETTKAIRIDRIQLETDSGKSIHDAHPHLTLIDLNRAGIGLFEIISQPDINSPLEAGLFLKQIIFLLNHINVSPALMGQGSLRCDANVSVRRAESGDPLGERCEIKNLNSVKSLVNAIEYEAKRQVELLESGNVIEMETRWFDPVSKTTFTARKKEDKIDYRFFPEPDLPPIVVEQSVISSAYASMPKLPSQIIDELLETYKSSGITKKMAHLICYEQGGVQFFKSAVQEDPSLSPLVIMQWLLNDILGYINADVTLNFSNLSVTPKQLVQLIQLTEAEYVSVLKSKNVLEMILKEKDPRSPKQIIDDNNWAILSMSVDELEDKCKEYINKFPKEVELYRSGKSQMIQFFVGQVMRDTKGKVSAKKVQHIFDRMLK